MSDPRSPLAPPADFPNRHLGLDEATTGTMLSELGLGSLDELVSQTVPEAIRLSGDLDLPPALTEAETLMHLQEIAGRNQVLRSFLGMGYHGTFTPAVIRRNILENPGWYTQYTPYQAEISQGRLEALLNYQTMIGDLTGLPVANSSLLDEATAAAEAMTLLRRVERKKDRTRFLIDANCHPQTLAVVQGRAEPLGIETVVAPADELPIDDTAFGLLLQYPGSDGELADPRPLMERAKTAGVRVAMACDLLSLTLLASPGELGAEVAIGSSQRFGVPLGYGGPHAAFFATHEKHKRQVPGRIIGVSKDSQGEPALRMALQTREQHIRRENATSNICTAQVLLAIIAGAYAVHHGAEGLKSIATRVHRLTRSLADALAGRGGQILHAAYFDTLRLSIDGKTADELVAAALNAGFNIRRLSDSDVGIALDETTTKDEIDRLAGALVGEEGLTVEPVLESAIPGDLQRTSSYLEHPVFSQYRSETELLRYLKRLESRDLSLTTSMIPLGSCTMKLNAAAEMLPVTWPEIGGLHPFVPTDQAQGYAQLFSELEAQLGEITGLPAVSLQPNSGASGEYAGLLVIRAHHLANGDDQRDTCLIPSSAHGTNPASASLAGMKVVVVACDDQGNVDLDDLAAKAEAHADRLSALMVTYPSTHGVFEEDIRQVCSIVHDHGGQVYLDGANLNAQVGLCRPGDIGADVCHVNLHKTFCIPHGGGGPGMGPICTAEHLRPYLPGHPVVPCGGEKAIGAVSAAPWGSPSILPISWSYIRMMGPDGLKRASEIAILNANYLAHRLQDAFPILYLGKQGRAAHECILDVRPLEKETGVSAEDIAKRLMDYGFHAPTMSFPVAGTLMVEPTESEGRAELDRFADALLAIRQEVAEIADGTITVEDSPLRHAPHTAALLMADEWDRSYTRSRAAYPLPYLREHKFWPSVGRIDNVHGDRNLICSCPTIEAYAEASDS
ncbi:MAG: aminomethyl-transferring glycine dehydrogenase [Acidobacteriota bacterium]